jgi:hypothetical protein
VVDACYEQPMPNAAKVRVFHTEEPSMRVLRWITLPLLGLFAILATISGYRAIVQIYRLDLSVADSVLRPGSALASHAVSSGRVPADVQLDLVQGSRSETLAVTFIPANVNKSLDPRPRHGTATVVLTPEQLARFEPGPAIVRATAHGRMQWLRTPPPTVQERRVAIAK